MKKGGNDNRREQGAAVDVEGSQPGACASAVGVGTSGSVLPAFGAARSVQPAGGSHGPKRGSFAEPLSCFTSGANGVLPAAESAEMNDGTSASPAPCEEIVEVTVRRAEGERCDCVGRTPGGRVIAVNADRNLHIAGSMVVSRSRHIAVVVRTAKSFRRFCFLYTGWKRAKRRFEVMSAIERGKIVRDELCDDVADALGEFLLVIGQAGKPNDRCQAGTPNLLEKGGLA